MKILTVIKVVSACLLVPGLVTATEQSLPLASVEYQSGAIQVQVDDARPLAAALDKLSRLLRVPICYEDPPWSHPSQLMEVTIPNKVEPTSPHGSAIVPRRYRWEARLVPKGNASDEVRVLDLLDQLIEQYHGSGLPGTFEVTQSDRFFYVRPVAYKAKDGKLVPYDSPMDQVLTIPPTEGSIDSLIGQVLDEIDGATPWSSIGGGMIYIKPFFSEQGALEAGEEPAWRVLQSVLEQSEVPVFWVMFFAPELNRFSVSILPIK